MFSSPVSISCLSLFSSRDPPQPPPLPPPRSGLTGLTHLDHITFVCLPGTSQTILDWYRDTAGMEPFIINPGEGSQLEVVGEAGLSLSVGCWLSEWLCREVGGEIESQAETVNNFKLVLAEPLGLEGHVNRRVDLDINIVQSSSQRSD